METKRRDLSPDLFRTLDVDRREGERIAASGGSQRLDPAEEEPGAVISLAILILHVRLCLCLGSTAVAVLSLRPGSDAEVHWPPQASGSAPTSSGATCGPRVWEGTRVSLYIGLLAACLDLFVGVTFGAVSGFLGVAWTTPCSA